MPRQAISIGIGTILEHCRRCLLLAFGVKKAKAIREAIEGSVAAMVPASALQIHAAVTFVIDEDAAATLDPAESYRGIQTSAVASQQRLPSGINSVMPLLLK